MRASQHRRHLLASASVLAIACAAIAIGAGGASAAAPRASLVTVEREVMCVTCKIPLNVAESPQSTRERVFIQNLINEGRDEAQIKQALVAQYGPTVLALPSTHGFDLAAYLVPAAVVLGLIGLLLALLPRWRAQARRQAATAGAAPPLSAADAARLQSDLSRFD
jgi:cytochrome c-type biogenesis protein CcmH